MDSFILMLLGVGVVIAVSFYQLGASAGRKTAYMTQVNGKVKSLEDAVQNATEVLKKERAAAVYYKTERKQDKEDANKLIDEMNGILKGIDENFEEYVKYLNLLRGDMIYSQKWNEEAFDLSYFYHWYCLDYSDRILARIENRETTNFDIEASDERFKEYRHCKKRDFDSLSVYAESAEKEFLERNDE